ncbi:MAG: hypothetical protein IPH49_05755 [Ignavibacteria bacterium]|nr:hypothetical protein [Ignavibacteria bacterium]
MGAQTVAPTRLPDLNWVVGSSTYESRWLEQFAISSDSTESKRFLMGWNWNAPHQRLGEKYGTTVWHVHDYTDMYTITNSTVDDMQRVFGRTYVPGMLLIPAVRGISTYDSLNDTTGGVFGFKYHNGGTIEGSGQLYYRLAPSSTDTIHLWHLIVCTQTIN